MHLAEYHRLKGVLDEERERSPVYEQWCRAGLHVPAPVMPVEEKIAHLDRLTHRHGFFFWHHWVDDGLGGEDSAYTIEEIKPTGMFDIERAEARFNEIQRMPKSTPGDVIGEQGEIDHEAHRNGLAFEWNDPAQAFTCVQL